MHKYRGIVRENSLPYVIALNNLSCGAGHDGAMEVLYGNCLECLLASGDTGPEHGHMWDTPGLFQLRANSHVSAVLHENDSGAMLIPNPNADIPVPAGLFPFARIAEAPEPVWFGKEHENPEAVVGSSCESPT